MLFVTLAVIVGVIYLVVFWTAAIVAGIRALVRKWKRDTGR